MLHDSRFRLPAALLLAAALPFALGCGGTEASRPDRPDDPGCVSAALEVVDFLDLPPSPTALDDGVRIARVRADLPGSTGDDQILRLQRRDQTIEATLVDRSGRETRLDADSFVATAADGCNSGAGCQETDTGGVCCTWACSHGSDELDFESWIVMTCINV